MRVSKKTAVLAGVTALTVLAAWIVATQSSPNEKTTTITPSWETKESTGGNVTVAVTLVLRDIADVPTRTFTWNINKQ